jgi:hypothetical protein
MDHVKLVSEETKGGNVVYNFGFAYTNKNQEIKWVEDAVIATRAKNGDWSYEIAKVKDLDQNKFDTYRNMLGKVFQVVETNAANLSGIKAVKK